MLRAFVNCAMMLKKRLNFFYFQWKKVDQVRNQNKIYYSKVAINFH